jgi:hypothetical protein
MVAPRANVREMLEKANGICRFLLVISSFLSIRKSPLLLTRTSVAIFNVVSINMGARNDLSLVINNSKKLNPDILCLQETVGFKLSSFTVSTLSDRNALRQANRLYNTNASAIFLNNRVGLIFFNPAIKIQKVEIQTRFIKANVTIDTASIPALKGENAPHRKQDFIVYSVYVSADTTDRRHFFINDILKLRSISSSIIAHVIIEEDFNDFCNS